MQVHKFNMDQGNDTTPQGNRVEKFRRSDCRQTAEDENEDLIVKTKGDILLGEHCMPLLALKCLTAW
jgi:hypothetical protein